VIFLLLPHASCRLARHAMTRGGTGCVSLLVGSLVVGSLVVGSLMVGSLMIGSLMVGRLGAADRTRTNGLGRLACARCMPDQLLASCE
jgi:hypothetical protein